MTDEIVPCKGFVYEIRSHKTNKRLLDYLLGVEAGLYPDEMLRHTTILVLGRLPSE